MPGVKLPRLETLAVKHYQVLQQPLKKNVCSRAWRLFLCSARTPEVPVLRLAFIMEMLLPKLIFFQHFLFAHLTLSTPLLKVDTSETAGRTGRREHRAATLLADQGGSWLSSPARSIAGRRDPKKPPPRHLHPPSHPRALSIGSGYHFQAMDLEQSCSAGQQRPIRAPFPP